MYSACALNEMAIRRAVDGSVDGFDSGITPVGERALSNEVGSFLLSVYALKS